MIYLSVPVRVAGEPGGRPAEAAGAPAAGGPDVAAPRPHEPRPHPAALRRLHRGQPGGDLGRAQVRRAARRHQPAPPQAPGPEGRREVQPGVEAGGGATAG